VQEADDKYFKYLLAREAAVLTLGALLRVNLAFCWGNASICLRWQQLTWLCTHGIAIFVVHAMPAGRVSSFKHQNGMRGAHLVVGFQGNYKMFCHIISQSHSVP
jgi:hypothetical protein